MMKTLARQPRKQQASQQLGSVILTSDTHVTVRTEEGDLLSRRAVSCLVEPRCGDRVLIAVAEDASWVLAVLDREDAGAVISVDGDLTIRQRHGRMSIAAQEGVSVVSGADVSVASASVDINAVDGNIVLQRLNYLGRFLHGEVDKVKMAATTLEGRFERLSQRVKRSFRRVDEVDQVRSARIDYQASANMRLRGRNTMMSAEQLIKVDGEQIHLG